MSWWGITRSEVLFFAFVGGGVFQSLVEEQIKKENGSSTWKVDGTTLVYP